MAKLDSITRPLNLNTFIAHLRMPLYRNSYALIASTLITSALGLLYWAVAGRLYSTDEVGLNSMAISIMIFLSSIAQINLQETMIRFLPRSGTRTLRMIVMSYGIVIALSAVVGIVFCLGIAIWSPSLGFLINSPVTLAWFVITIILWSVFVIEDSIFVGLRQALWIPLENAVFSVGKILLLVAFAAILPHTGIFISWTVAVAAIVIPVNWLLFRRLIPRHVEQTRLQTAEIPLRQISKYVAGNYAAALLSSMSSALLPLVITQIAGATANAHFYLAWIIAGSLQIVAANMATSLTVEASSGGDVEQYKRRALIGIARLLIPAVVLLVIGAPLILQFVGESYGEEGTLLLQLLAIAALPNMFNMVHVGVARVQNRIADVIMIYGANAIMVLGLSVLLLPSIGITGVGLAWVISQTMIAIALFVLPKRSLLHSDDQQQNNRPARVSSEEA